ncbi:hypothetical protein D9756_011432 [Leucocoprinus leucothites]|uniref:Uncharacterized protein n=1 Tax=Leucocoprinus leucothites TaxID=201217 RepID=A0A8H5CNP3_9AGAR|nr:hypothetical protein D9756_011432 [Leucoagaricus leucothites]
MVAVRRSGQQSFLDNPPEIPSQHGRPFSEYVAGFMFQVFLYGINVLLFFSTVFILVRKSKGLNRWTFLAFAVVMFSIATASTCTSMYLLFGVLISGRPIPIPIARAQHMYMFFNTSIADVLLICRCYAAWDRSKYIIAVPCAMFLGSSVCGMVIMSEAVQSIGWRKFVYLWLTMSLNVLVTTLTVVRVWWMGHQVRKALGSGLARKYYSFLAVIVESGAIYSLYLLIDQVLVSTNTPSFYVDAGLTQIAFTAPTLIIVQLGLGRHIRDVQTTIRLSQEATVILSTVNPDNGSMNESAE